MSKIKKEKIKNPRSFRSFDFAQDVVYIEGMRVYKTYYLKTKTKKSNQPARPECFAKAKRIEGLMDIINVLNIK